MTYPRLTNDRFSAGHSCFGRQRASEGVKRRQEAAEAYRFHQCTNDKKFHFFRQSPLQLASFRHSIAWNHRFSLCAVKYGKRADHAAPCTPCGRSSARPLRSSGRQRTGEAASVIAVSGFRMLSDKLCRIDLHAENGEDSNDGENEQQDENAVADVLLPLLGFVSSALLDEFPACHGERDCTITAGAFKAGFRPALRRTASAQWRFRETTATVP